MTTQQVANRYFELANQSKWTEIQDEFHGEDVICQEPEHVASRGLLVMTKGRDAVKAKSKANREMIEAVHSQSCSEPIVAGNFFSVVLKRDITFKNMPRMNKEEVGIFQVTDGKIVWERFFY